MQQSTGCSLGEKTHIHHPRSDLLWVESKPRIGVQRTSVCTRQKRTQHAVVNSLPRHIRSNADPAKARHSASSSGRLLAALVASRTQQSATKKEEDPYKPIPDDYSTLSSFQKTQTKKAESSRETKHRTENRTCYRSTIPTPSTNTERELNISDRNQFLLRR
jgi:hypothetical protein